MHGIASFEVAPDLAIAITGHSGAKLIGGTSSFDLRAENFGPFAATNVQFGATLPSGLAGVTATTDRGSCAVASGALTCTVAVLRPNEVANVHVVYTVPAKMLLPITATISGHERDPDTSTNSSQATAFAGEFVDLIANVTASAATADVGGSLIYTVQVTNSGPADSTGATMTFTPSSGLSLGATPIGCVTSGNNIVCDVGALAAGVSRSYAITTTVRNTGTVAAGVSVVPSSIATDQNATNNTSTVTTSIRPEVDIVVGITDTLDPVTTAGNFDYRVTVRNSGPDSAPNVVALLNRVGGVAGVISTTQGTCLTVIAGVQCNLGGLAPSATATITMSVSSVTPTLISLQASATSDGNDRNAGNNTAQESTTVNAPPTVVPANDSSGGGGGTSSDRELLLLGLLFVLSRVRTSIGTRSTAAHN
jgi:uncharacterized repeat protein (TIGR01451 family)